jgi:hypothetical protein
MNPFKTPQQMLMEQAHIPHYQVGGNVIKGLGKDLMQQFSGRIQEAIKKYVRATGKMPSKEEIAQLEDHIKSLTKPAPSTGPAPTRARVAAETPFPNKLVDANGRPYSAVPDPITGKLRAPEEMNNFRVKDKFGMGRGNMAARKNLYEAPHVNAFGEDPFLSVANTGRTPERTWMKSFTPSTEELAQRELQAAETGVDDAMGGLSQVRATEGDIPTIQPSQIAETASSLEAPAMDKISTQILLGEHKDLVRQVEQDFRSRGIVPDQEDIINAVTAMINPMRHNYTGMNPIGQRPTPPRGRLTKEAEVEMNNWRDMARASGLNEKTISERPVNWSMKNKQDYLLDTEPGKRGSFAKDWELGEYASGGMIPSSNPNDSNFSDGGYAGQMTNQSLITGATPQMNPTNNPFPHAPQNLSNQMTQANMFHSNGQTPGISPADMQAQMLVRGYADGKIVKKYRPTAGDFGRSALQGLTMGWGDEGEAAIRALMDQGMDAFTAKRKLSDLVTGKKTPSAYEQQLARIQAEQKQFQEAMPNTDLVLQAIGAAPHLLMPALRASTIPAMLAQGAVYGAGTANPGERLEGAAYGAPLGVALGLGARLLGGAALPVFGGAIGASQAKPGEELQGAGAGALGGVALGKGMQYAGKGVNAAYQAARRRIMNSEARLAEEVSGRPFDFRSGMKATSSPERQEWIGRSHEAGVKAFMENDPAYKAAVYASWLKNRPEIIKQSGAQNYDQLMKAVYDQAAKETGQQFKSLPNKVRMYSEDEAAQMDYLARAARLGKKPAEFMREQLAEGKPFNIFKDTGNPHPYLAERDPLTGMNQNEQFRAVHDYFGHLGTKKPNTFGPKGEENAWLSHRQMYSPLAEPAVTSETRGANSFVNYVDPKNLALRKRGLPTTEYAENKPVLLPAEASDPAYAGGMPEYLKRIIK